MIEPRQKKLILSLACVLAIAFWGMHKASQRSIELPGGLVLRFEGATFGTNAFSFGSRLENTFQNWIPTNGFHFGALVLEPPLICVPRSNEDAHVWISLRHRGTTKIGPPVLWQENTRIIAFDDKGRTFENGPVEPQNVSSGVAFLELTIHSYPRESEQIHLGLFSRVSEDAWQMAGTWTFRNPKRIDPFPLAASPLPATNVFDDVSIELREVAIGRDLTPKQTNGSPSVRFTFAISDPKPFGYDAWQFLKGTVSDSQGNHQVIESENHWWTVTRQININQRRIVGYALHPLDPADTWKIEAEFSGPAKVKDSLYIPVSQGEDWVSRTNRSGNRISARLRQDTLEIQEAVASFPPTFELWGVISEDGTSLQKTELRKDPHGQTFRLSTAPPKVKVILNFSKTNIVTKFLVRPKVLEDVKDDASALHGISSASKPGQSR